MLLTWIAELADEPLALEPDDRPVEWETNTWWLAAEDEDRRALTVAEVVAAFERTAARLRERVRGLDHAGPATFYAWHDEQAGQLRCSTASVGPGELPFGGAYRPVEDLGPIVADYLADDEPAVVQPSDVNPGEEPELPPFPVWVRAVGAPEAGS
ncbi:hypothetical protein ACIG5E_00555 [Kitasatospora sp. NPDC053057]|uniref:hypothetical protein n=1 Tax=Kitasatospora sp. NPDC053057 TaxID=3364062 RepID=UPI0037C5981A